ncbi:hypothetical protein Y032_0003g1368 [Ancylostoma ceylanicum]|uniref:Uncharacterized protein n=1 Tax=Ancylostoma ceylanicum TaxID=53326 RepID=A0A016VYH7_9BILA|nr:hypothetical protein Y032_0003g1368 [Ancylostoma ceylanicum]
MGVGGVLVFLRTRKARGATASLTMESSPQWGIWVFYSRLSLLMLTIKKKLRNYQENRTVCYPGEVPCCSGAVALRAFRSHEKAINIDAHCIFLFRM